MSDEYVKCILIDEAREAALEDEEAADPSPQAADQDWPAEYDGPSKSQRKREALALVDLARELVEMKASRLAGIPLPTQLAEAVAAGRAIRAHGGRKRQIKYIGKLLRDADTAPILAALDSEHRQTRAEADALHHLEALRERLLAGGDAALGEVLAEFPTADRQHLRALTRQAQSERASAKPPRAARQLFRYLRELGGQTD